MNAARIITNLPTFVFLWEDPAASNLWRYELDYYFFVWFIVFGGVQETMLSRMTVIG